MRSRHRQATQRSERAQRLHKFFTRKYADTFAGANSVRPFDLHDEIIKGAVKKVPKKKGCDLAKKQDSSLFLWYN